MTIATVTILASPSSPIRSVKQASLVFEGLCAITQSLLQFHRPSLGGRFHLLVPLMQRLLSCLFVPSSKDAGTINRFKHPTWLDQRTASLSLKHKNTPDSSRIFATHPRSTLQDTEEKHPNSSTKHAKLVCTSLSTRLISCTTTAR
jgi:hypothetical protein